MAVNTVVPCTPPTDSNIALSTWAWLKTIWRYLLGTASTVASQTASFTPALDFHYPCDATSGNITVSLPLTSDIPYKKYSFTKTNTTNTVTITCASGDTFQGGGTSIVL